MTRKTEKTHNMIVKGLLVLTVMIFLPVLMACGNSQKLSEQFDEQAVKSAAETLIGYLSEEDVESFCAAPMSEKMEAATTPESMSAVVSQYIGNRGAFVEYKSNVAVGAKDENGEACAVAVVVAKYENQTVTYTISFDQEMKLIGFYLK